MGIDEELLAREDTSADRAGELRRAQNLARRESQEQKTKTENQTGYDFNSLRHQAQAAKIKEEKAEVIKKAAFSPLRKATSSLLRQSWLNLIDSFGLTLIWINIHLLLHVIFGDNAFCKLGDEWGDMGPGAMVEKPEYLNKFINLGEGMALAALDLLLLIILICILLIIRIIVGVMTVEYKTLKELFSAVWDMFSGFVS